MQGPPDNTPIDREDTVGRPTCIEHDADCYFDEDCWRPRSRHATRREDSPIEKQIEFGNTP